MIFSNLQYADRYADLHPHFKQAFAALQSFDTATPNGRIDLQGDDAYLLVQRYTTHPAESRKWESHRDYLDIQVVFEGKETIYYEPTDRLEVDQPYDAKIDAALYKPAEGSGLDFQPRDFAIFYPEDGHKPLCQCGGPSEVVKVVAKIRV